MLIIIKKMEKVRSKNIISVLDIKTKKIENFIGLPLVYDRVKETFGYSKATLRRRFLGNGGFLEIGHLVVMQTTLIYKSKDGRR